MNEDLQVATWDAVVQRFLRMLAEEPEWIKNGNWVQSLKIEGTCTSIVAVPLIVDLDYQYGWLIDYRDRSGDTINYGVIARLTHRSGGKNASNCEHSGCASSLYRR